MVSGENMTKQDLAFHQQLAANFVNGNQAAIRGGGDERWMYKYLNSNSIIPPEPVSSVPQASSSGLSDASSADLVLLSDTSTASCASGWTQYSGTGYCYQQSSTTMSWYEAEAWCWSQRAGAHLASVHSQAEAVWLNAQYKVWYLPMDDWIGMRRDCDNVTYIWTDGSPVDFQWWQPSYPQSAYAEQSCVTIWDTVLLHLISGYVPGQFDDMKNCGEGGSSALCKYDPNLRELKRVTVSDNFDPTISYFGLVDIGEPYTGSVCTTPGAVVATTAAMETTTTTTTTTPSTTTLPTTPSTLSTLLAKIAETTATPYVINIVGTSICTDSSNCPTNWVEYNSKCYALITATATYSQAIDGCQSYGATLVEITSSDENEALRKAFSTNLEPSATSITNQAWIGNSSYTNWAPGEPNQGGTVEYCNVFAISPVEELGYSRGVWANEPCTSTQQYAICSMAVLELTIF